MRRRGRRERPLRIERSRRRVDHDRVRRFLVWKLGRHWVLPQNMLDFRHAKERQGIDTGWEEAGVQDVAYRDVHERRGRLEVRRALPVAQRFVNIQKVPERREALPRARARASKTCERPENDGEERSAFHRPAAAAAAARMSPVVPVKVLLPASTSISAKTPTSRG